MMKGSLKAMEELNSFLKYDGVLAVIMIKDGTVIEGAGLPVASMSGLASSLSLLMKESGMIAGRLRNELLSMIFLEFEGRLLLLKSLEDNLFMVVITRSDANIGQISYRLRKGQVKQGAGT